jgi:phosphoribosylamine--glycine ligase
VLVECTDGDFAALLYATASGTLPAVVPTTESAAVCVVLAAEGYPLTVATGDVISGLDAASRVPGVTLSHAGVALGADGSLVTAGGRVVGVTGKGATLAEARKSAYEACSHIHWRGMQYRNDIAELDASALTEAQR